MATAARGKPGSKRTRDDALGSSDQDIFEVEDEYDPGTPSRPGHGSKRLSRNMSEKMRRVRMNNYMMELASIVPSIVNAHKKLDKTTILRLTVNFLRLHTGALQQAVTGGGGRPNLHECDTLNKFLAEQLNGFLLLIDGSGTILYSSDSIQQYLGINVEDVLGQPVSCIVHPRDVDVVRQQLLSTHPLLTSGKNTEYRSAELRLLTNIKGREPSYTKVKITGPLKSNGGKTSMLIGVVQPIGAEHFTTEISPNFNVSTTQYISKHSLAGKFMDVDARACLLVGYLPREMHTLSAYDVIHPKDLPFAANAHLTMLRSNGAEIPTSLLRLKAKNGNWIYSYTTSHLVVDMWTKKHRYLLSVNDIVSKLDGERALEQQRKLLEDLNLDKLSKSDPQAIGQTVLEVATELADSERSRPRFSSGSSEASSPGALSHGSGMSVINIISRHGSPALLDISGEEGLEGETYGTVCGSDSSDSLSVINSSITSYSGVSSNDSSPMYQYSSPMSSSSVDLNSNDSSSVLLDDAYGVLVMSSSGMGMMTPSPVNLEPDRSGFSQVPNSSCSTSPSSDDLNSPGMDTLPGYQDSVCRQSSLENHFLSSSFQTLHRSDASHIKISSIPIYPQRSHASEIPSLFMDSPTLDPMDMDSRMPFSALEETFQPIAEQYHSSIKDVTDDTSSDDGATQMDGSES